ncbi:MAG: cytochrome c oxidase accessory protein CcoG, partial [Sphingomonadaceae bacterium]|nr:cytochrome c oxidase accessory protein CcoG [Sphingomonadaceae bacterium]
RTHTDLTVAADRNPPYMLMGDGSVRNSYTLRLRNMESRPRDMEVAITGLPGAVMWTDTVAREQAAEKLVFNVPADAIRTVRAYVVVPSGAGGGDFAFTLTSLDEQRESDTVETGFSTPGEQ